MFTITLTKLGSNYGNIKDEILEVFSFEDKATAKKELRMIAKANNMTKSPVNSYWNSKEFTELSTNF